jgi:hypothetical protein
VEADLMRMKRVLMKMRGALTKALKVIPRLAGGWRRTCDGLVTAALAFACGAGLAHSTTRPPRADDAAAAAREATACVATQQAAPQASPSPCSTPYDEAADLDRLTHTPALLEWENKHNGAQLPLRYEDETLRWGLSEGKVVVTPSGRTLATAGDTLYMLDASRRRVIWKYTTFQMVFDFAYVEATGLVYATAGDNVMFILDAATGRERYTEGRNGSASYGAVIPYGDDSCLVMDSFGFYRSAYTGGYAPTADGVTAWRGTKILWHVDVPPDAELQVVGKRIYAVTKTKTRILVREIKVPKGAR